MEYPNRNRTGFTLVEVMLVVVVIAILAGLVLPRFMGVQSQSARGTTVAYLQGIQAAMELYISDHGSPPSTGGLLRRLDEPMDGVSGDSLLTVLGEYATLRSDTDLGPCFRYQCPRLSGQVLTYRFLLSTSVGTGDIETTESTSPH